MRYCTTDNLAEIQAQISDVIRNHLGNNAITRTEFYKGSLIIVLSITGIVLIAALSPGRLKLILQDIENIVKKTFRGLDHITSSAGFKTAKRGFDILGDVVSIVSKLFSWFGGLPDAPPPGEGWSPI
jgi:hypothetical protein